MRTKLTELREQLDKVSKSLVSLDTSKPGALEEMRTLDCETVRIVHNVLCLFDAGIDYMLIQR